MIHLTGCLPSHRWPVNLGRHVQVLSLTCLIHTPPFSQGFPSHSIRTIFNVSVLIDLKHESYKYYCVECLINHVGVATYSIPLSLWLTYFSTCASNKTFRAGTCVIGNTSTILTGRVTNKEKIRFTCHTPILYIIKGNPPL